jgi:hypothetical protein
MIGGQVQPNSQPELIRLSQGLQTPKPPHRFQNILQERNKIAGRCAGCRD